MTRLAPARSSFSSVASSSARATMNTPSLRKRALMVMKRLSASESRSTMSARARAMPRATEDLVARGIAVQRDRPFADAVSYFDQAFSQGGYEVQARVQTPSSVAWTVKRPDGTVADAVVRNTKPTTIELTEVGTTAMKVEPAR